MNALVRGPTNTASLVLASFIVGNVFFKYELWNFNSGNYLFTTDTK